MTLRNVVSIKAGLGPNGDYGSSIGNFECVEDRMENVSWSPWTLRKWISVGGVAGTPFVQPLC